MSDRNVSKDYVLQRLAHYRKEKRLQGFLLHKSRNRFKKMKTEVRKLELGVLPSAKALEMIKVRLMFKS